MALNLGELVAYLRADNTGFRRGLGDARHDMQRLARDADQTLGKLGSSALTAVAGRVAAVAGTLARSAVSIAAVAATAVSAAPLLAGVAVALGHVLQAAGAASPALLAFGAAAVFTKLTLAQIFKEGSAARAALQPLADAFAKAGDAASKAAARGIRPLVEQLSRTVMPHVRTAMVQIGQAVNRVQRDFLNWANSARGVATIRNILGPIGATVQGLAPRVSRLVIAFAEMLGRITGVSLAAGRGGLAGVLDWLADRLDAIDAGTVTSGFARLRRTFETVTGAARTVAGWVRKVADAYRMYSTQFRAVADAVSVAAIAFGGPVVAIVAGIGLIIRHFDQFKAAYDRFRAALASPATTGFIGDLRDTAARELPQLRQMLGGFMGDLRTAGSKILPEVGRALSQIWEKAAPRLKEIYRQLTGELIPAFGQFIAAVSPVVAFFVRTLGPVVAGTLGNLLRIISGAIKIITGIFTVFTGILTGDWRKVWAGLGQIASGAGKILGALVRQIGVVLTGAWRLSTGLLVGIAKGALRLIVNAFKGLGGALGLIWRSVQQVFRSGLATVRSAVTSGAAAVRGAWSSAMGFVQSLTGRAMSALKSAVSNGVAAVIRFHTQLPQRILSALGNLGGLLASAGRAVIQGLLDGISSMLGKLKILLGKVTGLIPDWKGPASRDKKLLYKTGRLIMRGLVDGMTADVDKIKSTAQRVTERIRKAFEGKKTKIDDRLIATLKKSTARLVGLAREREKVAARIAAAKEFAGEVTGNARSFAALTGLDFGSDAEGNRTAPTAAGIRSGLAAKLGTLKAFLGNIRKLAKKGIPQGLLRQIMEAGPEEGNPLAQALLSADSATFSAIGAIQREIDATSKSLGMTSADILYDAGRGAGRGFLTGLQDQQARIQQQMDRIADRFAKKIAKAFDLPRLGVEQRGGGRPKAALHVEHYHEAACGSVRGTAEELLMLSTARG